jgi:hypothetical protein
MDLVNELKEISATDRIIDLERRQDGFEIKGDFEGNVTASWVKLDPSGAGIVVYKSKQYYTKTIGFTSLPKGTLVELSFANGTYISKY